jgi:hypothetical protein
MLEAGDFASALDAFERAYVVAEPTARNAILFNIALAASKAGNCQAAAKAVETLGSDPAGAELAEGARQDAETEGCKTPSAALPGVPTRGPPPSPAVAGGGATDGVVVAKPVQRTGSPFDRVGGAAEDFDYSCYRGDGRGAIAKRHVRVGKSRTVTVHERPGAPGAGALVEVAPGSVVVVKSEVVVSIPHRAYRVTRTGTCSCASELCRTEVPVTASFEEGKVVYARRASGIGEEAVDETDVCTFGVAELECADDSWLREASAECFRRHVEPVQLRTPQGVAPGWWIQIEQGWVHADGEFELQVMCDGECEALVEQCLGELDCSTPKCEKKCAELHKDCKPSWQSAELSG